MTKSARFLSLLVAAVALFFWSWSAACSQTVADFRQDTNFEFLSQPPRFHLLLTATSTYDNFPDLSLPGVERDADSVRQLFETTLEYEDISNRNDQTIVSYEDFFARQLPAAIDKIEDGDVFVFYFSGHGFSYRNQNYIVPKEFPSDAETMLGNAIKVTDVIAQVTKRKRPSAIILIIDACRTDLALPASIDKSFDNVAFKLPPSAQEAPLAMIIPDPRQYTVTWFPTGPLSAAIARQDSVSPFTQAFVKAVTERSKNWKIRNSVTDLAETMQNEYNSLVGGSAGKTIEAIPSTNFPTAIPNLKISDEIQNEAEGEWAKSIFNAKRQLCLAPIRDFLFNFPWSSSRIAAETGLKKWIGTFQTTECAQKSQVALSACAITEGVLNGSFTDAVRIAVSPKRIPVSPTGILDCSAPTDADITEGLVATGKTLSEARQKLAPTQLRVSLESGRSWDALVLTKSTGQVISDVGLQVFEDEALTKPISMSASDVGTPTNQARSGNSLPFVVNDSLEIDRSALQKAYQQGARYKLNDIAKVQIPGKSEELFVRLPGNSSTEPVDMGTLLTTENIGIGIGGTSDVSLDSLQKTIVNLLAKKHTIFFVSVEFQSSNQAEEFPSLSYNGIMNTLFSKFKLDASRIVSSRRTMTSVKESGFNVSIFGI